VPTVSNYFNIGYNMGAPAVVQYGSPQWLDLRGRLTAQSSISNAGSSQRAVDGDDSSRWESNSCTHTQTDNSPYWSVDLGKVYKIESVKVTNRQDCCSERLSPFDIYVDDKLCAENVQIGSQTKEVACKAEGRVLKITDQRQFALTLCEVGIKGAEVVGASVASDNFAESAGKYLGGYAAGDSRARDVPGSKARCNELGASCGGITCSRDKASCTVRTSKDTHVWKVAFSGHLL
jgi:hypothetical protein